MECSLGRVGECRAAGEDFQMSVTESRIDSIRSASKRRGDTLHQELESDCSVKIHRKCASLYTSNSLVVRVEKRRREKELNEARHAKQLRSDAPVDDSGMKFDFKIHCLFCITPTICTLPCEYDAKVPHSRRKPASLVRTDVDKHGREFTKVICAKCCERNDRLGHVVKTRIESMLESDLHAADARYHRACKTSFLYNFKINSDEPEDPFFIALTDTMSANRTKMWNSAELLQEYEESGGTAITQRKTLMQKIKKYFEDALIVLSSPGIASIVAFASETTKLCNILKQDDDEDEIDGAVNKVAKKIQQETSTLKKKRNAYTVNIDVDIAREPISETLLSLLEKVSGKSSDSQPVLLIGNMITGMVHKSPTDLQISLGIAMRRNKSLTTLLHNYGVCCSYDEVTLFKYSAAVAVANEVEETKFKGKNLIHCCADNFDCEISSQNCKKLCHSLAMILAQTEDSVGSHPLSGEHKIIKRQKMENRHKSVDFEVPEILYDGPKKPPMPSDKALYQIPPLSFLCSQVLSVQRSQDLDYHFMKDMGTLDSCPEWSGYNTQLARKSGMAIKPKAKLVYLPLIDKVPASPSTILTAIEKGLTLLSISETGQKVLIFTVDQQLYKIAVDILFYTPSYFSNVIPLLGGMHTLMAFIHAVCIILSLELKALLSATFGSVEKMVSGKKYPQNFRALRMLTEEMLRNLLEQNPEIISMDDLLMCLNERSKLSKTTKLWTDILVKGMFIMTAFVRGVHEQDFPLQLAAVKSMLPYFAAAGCHNYLRYGSFYIHHMESLPAEYLKKLKNDCGLRLIPGINNSIFTDQFIESTYMRLGHGPGGVTGLAVNDIQMTKWALSFAICGEVCASLNRMSENETTTATVHKEESAKRIAADQKDRESVRRSLLIAIDPLDPDQHPSGKLLNIVTGEMAHDDINSYKALDIGQTMVKGFRKSWPAGFYDKLSKPILTMHDKKKHVILGGKKLYDQEMIYARIIGLMSSNRPVPIDACLSTELAAYPPALFDPTGMMRVSKKSNLKTALQITTSKRSASTVDTTVYDVSALLWTITWPTGALRLYIDAVKAFVMQALKDENVVFVFDRYFEDSTKAYCRLLRQEKQGTSRVHILKSDMPTPPRSALLGVWKNKIQLNRMIVEALLDPDFYISATQNGHSLTLAGVDDVPVEINMGVRLERTDLSSCHEEADPILVQHAISRCMQGEKVRVISDDTDVFLLLLHFYVSKKCTSDLYMCSPVANRSVVDLRATAQKNKDITKAIVVMHALTGTDTVAATYNVGKKMALKSLRAFDQKSLSIIGDPQADLSEVCSSGTAFLIACYGKTYADCKSMTECRLKMWKKKTGAGRSIKLSRLPPTTEATNENIKRAHYQVAHWLTAMTGIPPPLSPKDHGWEQDGSLLKPCPVTPGIKLAHDEILQMVRCGCEKSACKGAICKCSVIGCTVFCACEAGPSCLNPLTKRSDISDDEAEGNEGENEDDDEQ